VQGNSGGIFGLITAQSARNKGFGTDMMRFLFRALREQGCRYATLSASSDSGYRIYEGLGFTKIAEFVCFEWNQ
ncbi:MAG: GNAT family N-acetyltransferase, partial [Chlamydiia bacterium]|nr:GNAT family N-acetyltransferase [Chlamydiia bacterium]